MKILMIEDELDLLSALKKGFTKKGYAVDTAEDGNEGSYLAEVNEYDVIVLDLNLPYQDGLDILEEIRNRSQTQKVLILSARSSVPDKILGLDMGANDYLAKPFDFLELEARVRNLARREFIQKDSMITVGPITIDTAKKEVRHNGQKLELAPKEYAILEYLALHTEKVVSAEELIEHIWESDVNLFSVSVKVHISHIRKKLQSACGKEMIVTVRGCGYRIEEERHG